MTGAWARKSTGASSRGTSFNFTTGNWLPDWAHAASKDPLIAGGAAGKGVSIGAGLRGSKTDPLRSGCSLLVVPSSAAQVAWVRTATVSAGPEKRMMGMMSGILFRRRMLVALMKVAFSCRSFSKRADQYGNPDGEVPTRWWPPSASGG